MTGPGPLIKPNQVPSQGTGSIFTAIKAEYLSTEPSQPIVAADDRVAGDADDRDGGDPLAAAKEPSSPPPSSSSKKRKLDSIPQDNLCRIYATTGKCPYPAPCKKSHDLAAYVKQVKQPDLGTECIPFQKFGFCRSGIRCRFSASHVRDDYTNILPDDFDHTKPLLEPGVLNVPERKVIQDLRVAAKKNKKQWWKARKEKKEAAAAAAAGAVADDTTTTTVEPVERTPARVDWKNKLVCAPLTTVGNLPFRRVVKGYGCDITVGEMALSAPIIAGSQSEWALLKRHKSEDVFGVQIACSRPEEATAVCDLIREHCEVDFVDLNLGCPIDLLCHRGLGASLMQKPAKVGQIVRAMTNSLKGSGIDVTVKMRTGYLTDKSNADVVFKECYDNGATALALHGRSRQARYSNLADWEYIKSIAATVDIPVLGNGDVYDYHDMDHLLKHGVDGLMIARGALVKPWVFTELKERRHWDISATERLEMIKTYAGYGLDHWGSDELGVRMTRRFLLEWLSFLWRYVPVGILDGLDGKDTVVRDGRTWASRHHLHQGVPGCFGRSDLETLFMSPDEGDWIKVTEMVLGPVPEGYRFKAKHKAKSTTDGSR